MRIFLTPTEPGRPLQMMARCLLEPGVEVPGGLGMPEAQARAFTAAVRARYQLVPVQDCEAILLPYSAATAEDIAAAESACAAHGKPIVAFFEHDGFRPLPSARTLVLRTSAYRSKLCANERVMPALCSDPLLEADALGIPEPPAGSRRVGFCGYVGSALQVQALRLLGKFEKARGLALRRRALDRLERAGAPPADFIRRHRFRAGMTGDIHAMQSNRLRLDYLRNLLGSPFSLCVRGAGNYSFRFYEALACGRIPVLVESDDALPLEDRIDYRAHVVRVRMDRLSGLDRELEEFLHRAGSDIFARNREVWLRSLSPEGYIAQELPGLVSSWMGIDPRR